MDKGKHLKRAEIKNKIILELMDSPLSLDELKYRLKSKYNVSRLDVHYHLYNSDHGLTLRKNGKVVIEDKGQLRLNLEEGNAIVKILEYLSKDPQHGKRVSRFINKAFLEAFLSPYGDYYFSEGYDKEKKVEESSKGGKEKKSIETVVAMRNYIEGYTNYDAIDPTWGEYLISYGLYFALSVRNEDSTEFKVAYILKVMSIWRMAKALEKEGFEARWYHKLRNDPDPSLFSLTDFSVNRMTNQTIKEFLHEAESDLLSDFFNKVIRKAVIDNESEYFTNEWTSPFTLKPLLELKDTVVASLLVEALGEIVRIWNSTLKGWREAVMRMPPLDPKKVDRELERKKKIEKEKYLRRNDTIFKYWANLPTFDEFDKVILRMKM